ncbi:MAG TPA: hypothetical protein DHV69_07840 [Sphaerochaeta sp.]|nr:MAG: hypothetical protein A2Y31_08345 [Spirochaetes bacterium GWC2_52_13]OHD68737.1 MAG: hypothetical protein A2101_01890 [Spirochaetes bacterium GWF2_52_7]PKL20791.1 MAG: hypothetical protein CVV48_11040 [Spirochaetae bacterium HGW-Spirochaetae-4]HCG63935.1 hypothetical protein [Sphaerochaeta sp.]HCJ95087.1 hypothetical protein [Sphaerochaeta sp.]
MKLMGGQTTIRRRVGKGGQYIYIIPLCVKGLKKTVKPYRLATNICRTQVIRRVKFTRSNE